MKNTVLNVNFTIKLKTDFLEKTCINQAVITRHRLNTSQIVFTLSTTTANYMDREALSSYSKAIILTETQTFGHISCYSTQNCLGEIKSNQSEHHNSVEK